MELKLLIVDDHPLIVEGYKAILSYNTSNFTFYTKTLHDSKSAYYEIVKSGYQFDAVMVDLTLPKYADKGINSGEDLVLLMKGSHPFCKTIVLTSHTESFVIYKILENCEPDGLLLKSDITAEELIDAFTKIIQGEKYYSQTVRKYQTTYNKSNKVLDTLNIEIITLLSQGTKNKTIQDHLRLSKSAVDKRKVQIKYFLDIDKGNDEDIIREAKKRGLI